MLFHPDKNNMLGETLSKLFAIFLETFTHENVHM